MKCLAIRQPWAMLIAAGIKDVECRDKLVPPCKRFLIAASKKRDAKRLGDVLDGQLLDVVNGYIAKGILPPYEQWPTGAIIGYVDIKEVTYEQFYNLGSFPNVRALKTGNTHIPLLQFVKYFGNIPVIDDFYMVHEVCITAFNIPTVR